MGTQAGGYWIGEGKDRERVPSVTTVISRFKESGGLIHWAWKLGTEGKDYRQVRDEAADAGTLCHNMVEQWVKKQEVTVPDSPADVVAKAREAFGAFIEWADQSKLQVTETEVPMVSKKYKFGGTMDCLMVNGKRSVGDWKSSNRIYAEYLCQIAAYGKLWEENHPDEPVTGGYHLVRFGKEFGEFSHHWWADLSRAWEAFLHLRALYDINKELERMVGK